MAFAKSTLQRNSEGRKNDYFGLEGDMEHIRGGKWPGMEVKKQKKADKIRISDKHENGGEIEHKFSISH